MPKINPPAGGKKIIVVVGPTASGKSDLGIKLARKFNGEIISADSRQVYKGMDIGTGKVTKKERSLVKHHLLDVANPKKVFTVSDFKKLGQKAINDIQCRYKVPIIVGGTGFYIDVLLDRMAIAEVPPNKKLRAKLEKQSTEQLFKRLQKLDPRRAKNIDSKNKRRIIRALEIVLTIKKPVPKPLNLYHDRILNANVLFLGLAVSPEIQKKKIKMRLDRRLKQGMIQEIKGLIKQGISKKRLYDLGLEYRWLSRWLSKNVKNKNVKNRAFDIRQSYNLKFKDSEEYQNLLRDIIKYSKRQMTWFKRNKDIHWINPPSARSGGDGQKKAEKLIQKFIS